MRRPRSVDRLRKARWSSRPARPGGKTGGPGRADSRAVRVPGAGQGTPRRREHRQLRPRRRHRLSRQPRRGDGRVRDEQADRLARSRGLALPDDAGAGPHLDPQRGLGRGDARSEGKVEVLHAGDGIRRHGTRGRGRRTLVAQPARPRRRTGEGNREAQGARRVRVRPGRLEPEGQGGERERSDGRRPGRPASRRADRGAVDGGLRCPAGRRREEGPEGAARGARLRRSAGRGGPRPRGNRWRLRRVRRPFSVAGHANAGRVPVASGLRRGPQRRRRTRRARSSSTTTGSRRAAKSSFSWRSRRIPSRAGEAHQRPLGTASLSARSIGAAGAAGFSLVSVPWRTS